MSRIVQAVNSMVSNKLFNEVLVGPRGEIFFRYKKKYVWSLDENNNDFLLFFYPEETPIQILANYEADDWLQIPMVKYSTEEIGTKEARQSFAELYSLLQERVHGVNVALDDIISDDIPF